MLQVQRRKPVRGRSVSKGGTPVTVDTAVMEHHDQTQASEESVYYAYTSTSLNRKSGQELTQERNLEAGDHAEAMEECCLLAHSFWVAQLVFL